MMLALKILLLRSLPEGNDVAWFAIGLANPGH